jgi:TDG/mug DNA glycosylase family protein
VDRELVLREDELPAERVPMALAAVHRELAVGRRLGLALVPGARGWWDPHRASTVVAAAGFTVDDARTDPGGRIDVAATRARALPDHVGPGMRLLCCGLNPSLHAADAGVGYVSPSNRFWKALARAGLSTADRDPVLLLERDGIGMTDLVKRATARASELTAAEYRAGLARLEELCGWLRPGAVAVVGLAGWRAAVDRSAVVGWQPGRLAGVPVHVLASTSGLNARVPLDDLATHLRTAAGGMSEHIV